MGKVKSLIKVKYILKRSDTVNLHFREARREDINKIMTIEKQSFPCHIVEDMDTFNQRIDAFREGFIITQCGDEVIGYVCSELWEYKPSVDLKAFELDHSIEHYHKEHGNELYISSMGTLKDYRGHGYGKAQFNYIINKFKDKGVSSVILMVSPEFKHALEMYKSQGFQEIARMEHAFAYEDGKSTEGIIMRRLL